MVKTRIKFAAYIANTFDSPSFHIPIILFYGNQYLGLTITTTLLAFYGVNFLTAFFEIPAGAFGDRYGRKISYILGIILLLVGYGIWLLRIPTYWYFIGSAIAGLGNAFRSGSIDAMVYEESHLANAMDLYDGFRSKSKAWYYVFRIVAMPLGSYLFTVSPTLPMLLTIITIFCSGLSVIFIPDNNVTPEEKSAFLLMFATFKKILSNKESVLFILVIFSMGAIGDFAWRLFQVICKTSNLNIAYIGIFYGVTSIFSTYGSLKFGKRSKRDDVIKLSILTYFITTCTVTVLAVFLNIWVALVVVIIQSISFALPETSIQTYLQTKSERFEQATILSITSFVFFFGLSVSDVLAGISISIFGLQGAFIFNATLCLVITMIFVPKLFKTLKVDSH